MTIAQTYYDRTYKQQKRIARLEHLRFCVGCGTWKDKRKFSYLGYHWRICRDCEQSRA